MEQFTEAEQKQKIEEMNEIVDGMNEEEFEVVFNEEFSLLGGRFEQMIIEEEKKNEENEESLLVDLCECYLSLHYYSSEIGEIISIIVPCLLKAASVKEENEEAQKEVEMALLALSNINECIEVKQELYLKEITEIIKHQQKHRNLTHLAYQSAWLFFIYRFFKDRNLEDTIANELHFGREAARELEELTRNVNWKKKKEEMSKEEAKEELTLVRWLQTLNSYIYKNKLRNEENVELINSIVQIYRAAKGNNEEISFKCIYSLRTAAKWGVVKVVDLLNGGAVDTVLEGMQLPTLDDNVMRNCLYFFMNVSKRLKKKTDDELEEAKRKELNRKFFEKLEEEGYEDTIASFHEKFEFLHGIYSLGTLLKISEYFVNV
ncbi:uncharacterized protein MONOS_10930 [Monocercomonoides exilis]|uniref:uncharacterized protein n=1 Tax=Monocercomonoides exilis TaxID=2049356 RepID=UPI0035597189|nr:hypothetical protein MONOS_10930 [Monocercomonoides exilis]|eukprot:MONOS_10930.1-p1 / transcript=MONOS_10930.1 / gene=MONOS_10930 / organism=Monocercomonoides_exilis_PA203 / gene_product=unspecified product / transcript_product=unspecified product / location=Mono_scaffold00519:42230-43542(+) / protein_length=376 / sequence_SO=supercontig / SO=protein_coding / is_pseudo=false